ncbi:serine kinase [Novosphingobium fuchskuhlense]|uniref:Serine kinase n=1 Tax=Novosphingobium fuchskuhlense TaxID=1117702 RepID=A0A117UXS8_9SPHN|nr:HPr family phosphocarrier protein [Novosphingobium fuchskuhlense]KUR72821.1 serine kinase [Novosphingobium fuchskuhlense]
MPDPSSESAADTSATTARETVLIVNQRGLHARASAKFVNAVAKLPEGLDVRVIKDGTEAQGGSILGLMMLGAAKGDSVEIVVTGPDADGVLMKVAGLVKDGFGED